MWKKIFRFIVFGSIIALLCPVPGRSGDHPSYVRIPLSDISVNLEPGGTSDMLSTEIQTQLFLGLTQYDPNSLKARPYLAEKWRTSRDMKEFIFYLRKDAKWSDGNPVTAHDIVWAVRRNISPETGSELAYLLYVLKNGEKIHKGEIKNITKLGAHLIDDFTVLFELEYAAAYFPSMVAYTPFWPLPRRVIAKHGKGWTVPDRIVTNGPYLLSDIWEDEKVIVLEKNFLYHDAEKVKIPGIHYMAIEDGNVLEMYRENEIDILGGSYLQIPLTDIDDIKMNLAMRKQYSNNPRLCTYYYGFNNNKPPMSNRQVRKAFSAAIDRRRIVDNVTLGGEEPAYTFTRPPIFGSVDPNENVGIRFNPEMAKKWLAEAGYPDGQNFPEVVMMLNDDAFHDKIAGDVREQLIANLNIEITIKSLPWDEFMKNLYAESLEADIYRWGWCADYPDANNWLMENFHPNKSANLIHWQNKEFASLVDKAQRVTDTFTRKRLYKKAERILCEEEAAIAPLFYYTSPILIKPWLDAKIWPLLGNQIRTWSFND